jgi:hypothetical protein
MLQQKNLLMHQLSDLKKALESNKFNIKEFLGHTLKSEKKGVEDTWTLAHEVFYKNGEPVLEKDLPIKKK